MSLAVAFMWMSFMENTISIQRHQHQRKGVSRNWTEKKNDKETKILNNTCIHSCAIINYYSIWIYIFSIQPVVIDWNITCYYSICFWKNTRKIYLALHNNLNWHHYANEWWPLGENKYIYLMPWTNTISMDFFVYMTFFEALSWVIKVQFDKST